MEFPDLVLALIREFSRPCVSKEALQEYLKVVRTFGDWPSLKRKMMAPDAVSVVRKFNKVSDRILDIESESQSIISRLIQEHQEIYQEEVMEEVLLGGDIYQSPRLNEINRLLVDLYDERIEYSRNMRVLVHGEAVVREFEKKYGGWVLLYP